HFLRAVRLTEEEPANTGGKDCFHIAAVSFGNASVPRNRGIAVTPREINFAQREIRLGPIRFEARCFAQFAQTSIIFARRQSPNVMFKCIESKRRWRLVNSARLSG